MKIPLKIKHILKNLFEGRNILPTILVTLIYLYDKVDYSFVLSSKYSILLVTNVCAGISGTIQHESNIFLICYVYFSLNVDFSLTRPMQFVTWTHNWFNVIFLQTHVPTYILNKEHMHFSMQYKNTKGKIHPLLTLSRPILHLIQIPKLIWDVYIIHVPIVLIEYI